jgi:hypothetical protein
MTESIYEYVLQQLELAKGAWADIATATGVPLRSIEKIARKEWENPGVKHIDTLAAHFRDQAPRKTKRATPALNA